MKPKIDCVKADNRHVLKFLGVSDYAAERQKFTNQVVISYINFVLNSKHVNYGPVMAHSHCIGSVLGNNGFIYYTTINTRQ